VEVGFVALAVRGAAAREHAALLRQAATWPTAGRAVAQARGARAHGGVRALDAAATALRRVAAGSATALKHAYAHRSLPVASAAALLEALLAGAGPGKKVLMAPGALPDAHAGTSGRRTGAHGTRMHAGSDCATQSEGEALWAAYLATLHKQSAQGAPVHALLHTAVHCVAEALVGSRFKVATGGAGGALLSLEHALRETVQRQALRGAGNEGTRADRAATTPTRVLHCCLLPSWPALAGVSSAAALSEILFALQQQLHLAHSGASPQPSASSPCSTPRHAPARHRTILLFGE
jgi:hypothetical protein